MVDEKELALILKRRLPNVQSVYTCENGLYFICDIDYVPERILADIDVGEFYVRCVLPNTNLADTLQHIGSKVL